LIGVLPPAAQALKRATAQLVRAAGGQEAAAGFCRVRQQALSDYGNINQPESWIPADVVTDLEGITTGLPGAPHVTRQLAANAGFALVPLPPASGAAIDWMAVIGGVAKEAGDVVSALAMHCPDSLTAREIREAGLIAEFDEAIRILVEGRAAALAILAAAAA
jgi:hypothetical protein